MPIPKQIHALTFAFALIFLGFGGAQQFITVFFQERGNAAMGFTVLLLVYIFFTLASFFASVFIQKIGTKRCMISASVFYSVFIFSLALSSIPLILFSSILLGIAAGLLWTSQNIYLIASSDPAQYGKHAGYFSMFHVLSTAAGILIGWFLIAKYSYTIAFAALALLPIAGLAFLISLKELPVAKNEENKFATLKKAIASKTALRISLLLFSFMFVQGLAIGYLPIDINTAVGFAFVAPLSTLFYLVPIAASYPIGKLSDSKGRPIVIYFSYIACIFGFIVLFFAENVPLLFIGILLLTFYFAALKAISIALLGDIATPDGIVPLASLFWAMQNAGIVLSLFIPQFVQSRMIYLLALGIMLLLFVPVLPMLKQPLPMIKERIAREMGGLDTK